MLIGMFSLIKSSCNFRTLFVRFSTIGADAYGFKSLKYTFATGFESDSYRGTSNFPALIQTDHKEGVSVILSPPSLFVSL